LGRNPELLVNAAHADLIKDMDSSLYIYFNLDNVSQEKKNSIASQILKIAEKKNVEKAWVICEALTDIKEHPNVAARAIPILEKNLKIAENKFSLSKSSDDNHDELEGWKNKYLEILFDAHLSANDWRSAEKLLMEKYGYPSSFDSLILNAAKNGAFDDTVRYWKIKANLDRRNLDHLSSLKRFPTVAESIRQFYKQMKTDEPYSPVPDLALEILK
jgi:predicted nucleic acid-binding protein